MFFVRQFAGDGSVGVLARICNGASFWLPATRYLLPATFRNGREVHAPVPASGQIRSHFAYILIWSLFYFTNFINYSYSFLSLHHFNY
jgi:hypothetical protein